MKSYNLYPKPNKYKAKRVSFDRKNFASKLELDLFHLLKLFESAGELSNLRSQVSVFLTDANIRYIVDFCAIEIKSNKLIYFEAKGFETEVWRIKKKLWRFYGVGPLRIYVRGQKNAVFLKEEIIPPLAP